VDRYASVGFVVVPAAMAYTAASCRCGAASEDGARATNWGKSTAVRVGATALMAFGCLLAATAPAGAAVAPTVTRPLEQLWSRYPLAPKAQPAASPAASAVDRQDNGNRNNGNGVALTVVLGVGALAAAATLFVTRRTFGVQRGEGAAMSVFRRDRRPKSEPSDDLRGNMAERVRAATGQRGETQITEVIPEVVGGPAPEESTDLERAQRERTPAPAAVTAENIGEHVSSVLQSAQQAARTIQDDARREAASLVERARREADETRARASTEAAANSSDAERALQTAREQADQTRGDADAYAQRRRQEAEQQAAATLSDAKGEASSIQQAAKKRHEELLSNVAMTEDRLKVLSTALKNVARELDDLVEDESSAAGSEAPAREELDAALRSRTGATT
jgi:hypothetical protein